MSGSALIVPQIRTGSKLVKKPNILLLMADQLRGDCLGIDGNNVIQTPNLDQLAHEGIYFRHAYSSTPSCTPARAALLTGLSPWHHGMLGYGRIAEHYPREMPRLLTQAGYYSAVIGKCHYSPQRGLHGFNLGILDESGRIENLDFRSDYRAWFWSIAPTLNPDQTGLGWNDYRGAPYALPEELHPTRWVGDTAVRFIRSYHEPEPFFLKVSFERPHSPYDPPKRFWKEYEKADLPKAKVGNWAAKYASRSDSSYQIWHGDLGPQQVRQSRQGYYGNVTFVDEQIGLIVAALKQRNLLEETFIFFLSDHGDMTGDNNLWRKSYAYEPSARIAMLMRWPEGMFTTTRGRQSQHPVEIRDVLPTLLDVADSPQSPEVLDGQSLLDIVRGAATWREYIDLEHDLDYHDPRVHWNALTDGRTKYIFHTLHGEEQLFDLQRDPHELNDLTSEPESVKTLDLWRNRLIAQLQERGECLSKMDAWF